MVHQNINFSIDCNFYDIMIYQFIYYNITTTSTLGVFFKINSLNIHKSWLGIVFIFCLRNIKQHTRSSIIFVHSYVIFYDPFFIILLNCYWKIDIF